MDSPSVLDGVNGEIKRHHKTLGEKMMTDDGRQPTKTRKDDEKEGERRGERRGRCTSYDCSTTTDSHLSLILTASLASSQTCSSRIQQQEQRQQALLLLLPQKKAEVRSFREERERERERESRS